MAQVLPVLYLALLLEHHWFRPRMRNSSHEKPTQADNPWVYALVRWGVVWAALIFVLAEATTLATVYTGEPYGRVDALIVAALVVFLFLMVQPLIDMAISAEKPALPFVQRSLVFIVASLLGFGFIALFDWVV